MSSFSVAVIPDGQAEYAVDSADQTFSETNVVALRINDVTSGASLTLISQNGDSVTHDNLTANDILTGRWKGTTAATTTVDSIIVFYVSK